MPAFLRMHVPLNSAPELLELSGNEVKCSQWHVHFNRMHGECLQIG